MIVVRINSKLALEMVELLYSQLIGCVWLEGIEGGVDKEIGMRSERWGVPFVWKEGLGPKVWKDPSILSKGLPFILPSIVSQTIRWMG